MSTQSSETLKLLTQSHYSPNMTLTGEVCLSHLGLKWEAHDTSHHDFLQFIRRSRNENYLCLASSTL